MFVAGTDFHHGFIHAARDVISDLTLVPFGRTDLNARYTKLREIVDTHPVRTIVGHSLGAAVAGEFMRRNTQFLGNARLHGWPALGANTDPRIESYAGHLDPVALGDFTAHRRWQLDPHSYHGSH